MRIVENTPSRLKLRDRTLWISVVCLCAAGILVARVAFDHDQSGQLIPAALSVAFGLAFLHATDVTFDKIRRTCVISRFDVRGLARTRLAFEDIADIRVDIEPFSGASIAISGRLCLVTASADIPLTASYEPDLERHNGMRDTVLDMLFKDVARPVAVDPVRRLVKDGRIIDAVAILRMRDGLDLTAARARVAELRDVHDS